MTVEIRSTSVTVGVLRGLASRQSASDHRAVRVVFRPRRPRGQSNVTVQDCVSEGFAERVLGDLEGYPKPRDLTARMSILRKAAGRARGCARTEVLTTAPVAHSAHSALCLKVLSALKVRREGEAQELCRRALGHEVFADRDGGSLLSGIRLKLRSHVASQTLQDIASIEASAMPETHTKLPQSRQQQATGDVSPRGGALAWMPCTRWMAR